MTQEFRTIFEKIDFVNRYKDLCSKFDNTDDSFENYENTKVKEVMESFGYKNIRYYKGEDFFEVENNDRLNSYNISLSISFKYGLCEIILSGAPLDAYLDLLNVDTGGLKLPAFRSYDELHEILSIAFGLYEDYKREMIALYRASEDESN